MQLVTGDGTTSRGVRRGIRINPLVPEGPLLSCVTGRAPSPDVREKGLAYPFWQQRLLFLGKINSVLRCKQKLSHPLNSATFIEPVKKHPAHVQRRGGDWEKAAVSEPASERTWACVASLEDTVAMQGPCLWGSGRWEWTLTTRGSLCASNILAMHSE